MINKELCFLLTICVYFLEIEDTQGVIPKSDVEALKDDLSITWHTEPIEELITRVGTDLKAGLHNDLASRRYATDGPNSLDAPKRNGNLQKF